MDKLTNEEIARVFAIYWGQKVFLWSKHNHVKEAFIDRMDFVNEDTIKYAQLTKNTNKMKRVLFTMIYPFWFFFAKTWIGGVLMICLVSMTPALLIGLIFPNIMNVTGEEAKDFGGGLAIFSLLLSPFIAMPLMAFGDYLESHYQKWKYKIEMETKMI